MKKRVVSLLLCLIMALSLIPTVAFATEGDATPATDAKTTTNGAYDDNNNWNEDGTGSITKDGLTLSKTAMPVPGQDNTYEITLSVVTSQTTTTTTTTANAATVLVIDTSGSMAWCTKNHRHDENCYSTEECNTDTNPTHWETVTIRGHQYSYHKEFDDNWNRFPCRYSWKDGKYYKVENNCGQGAHNHDNARGGEWCKNKDLSSATDSRIANAKAAAKAFLDSYRDTSNTPAARWVAIVSFADIATSSKWFNVSTTEDCNDAKNAIDALTANGGTYLYAGLKKAQELMGANAVQDILTTNKNVIALTDGAPTKSLTYGNGKYGSENINAETEEAAKDLKDKGDIKNLYTICFAASNEECYQGGPSVSNFLSTKIASSADTAKTVADGDNGKLTLTFTEISNTIKDGLTGEGGWTVTDPMADNMSVVATSLPTGFVEDSTTKGTYIWTLANADVSGDGNTKTYTYTTSYRVTIDPTGKDANGDPLNEKDFYPTNKVTTLNYTDANGVEKHANFPVPGVKVKLSDPTLDKGTLTINKTITGLEKSKLPSEITFTVKDANGNVVATPKITTFAAVTGKTNEFTGSVPVDNLTIGQEYTVTEDADSAKVDGYTLTAPVAQNITIAKENNTLHFTNAYTEITPGATTAKITINKKVDVTGNTQPTATTMPTFQFVAKVGNTEVGKLSLTPTKGTDGKWTASGVMDITIPAKLFGANSYVEVKASEVKGTLTTWTYDTHPEMFYINKDGQRITLITAAATAAEVVPATDSIATFTFTNKYSYTYTPTPKPNPRPTPKPVPSAKTGDMGIALYALTSLLSLSGTALVIKKRKDEE